MFILALFLFGSCLPREQQRDLPSFVEVIKEGSYYLVVPDDTTQEQVRNLIHAFISQDAILKKWGIEVPFLSIRVKVFRASHREYASREGYTKGVLERDLEKKRKFAESIVATYAKYIEGGELATLGDPAVQHEVL